MHTWANDNLCVNRERIFASGFSNGGSMVFNLTCEMNSYFAGFAYTGATMPPATYPISDTCNGGLRLEQIKVCSISMRLRSYARALALTLASPQACPRLLASVGAWLATCCP